ncbi:nitroreductase family protein [Pseudomonas vancouverensis]|uniref:nitroreductase family protein n=1 Tax=Pseudomonas vancouverensis TaxID=95300 RepID=UPI003CFBFF74
MKTTLKKITNEAVYQKLRYPLIIKRTLSNIFYDAKNFIKNSPLRYQPKDAYSFSAILTMEYHKLEKAVTLPAPKKLYGKSIATKILTIINNNKELALECMEDTQIAIKALEDYCNTISMQNEAENQTVAKSISSQVIETKSALGIAPSNLVAGSTKGGTLSNEYKHFLEFNKKRKTVRNFSSSPVPRELIFDSVAAAKYTPSVCNRQPWKAYYLDSSEKIVNALRFQNGNSGFRESVPGLIIVTSSSKYFPLSGERNQLWIDGGMFSMNLLLSLHANGLGACALNWGNDSFIDKAAKEAIGIPADDSIIMMIAVGYPNENYKVCISQRKSTNSFITILN